MKKVLLLLLLIILILRQQYALERKAQAIRAQKAALLFQQYGLNQHDVDVVHVITGSQNSTQSFLEGTWILSGVCSLSDKSDVETIKHEVRDNPILI